MGPKFVRDYISKLENEVADLKNFVSEVQEVYRSPLKDEISRDTDMYALLDTYFKDWWNEKR